MNVLRVIASMNPSFGGPSQGIRNSIPEQLKEGIRNEVVTLDNADEAFIKNDSFVMHAIGKSKGPWCYQPDLLPWLKTHLHTYDFVIVHGLWLYPSYAVYKAIDYLKNTKQRIPKVFVMPHGMLDPYFIKTKGRKLKALRNFLYWKSIESKVIHAADAVLFTCEEELLLARKAYQPYKPQKELNTGYGIALPPTYQEKMQAAFLQHLSNPVLAKNYWLFLSRIHEKKGIDLLIKAYKQLTQETKGHLPNLIIAGPGLDTDYGQNLKRELDADNSIKDRIHFTGMLQNEAKWGAFYGADAFVLPSHQENFGISVAEALACGIPVLISDKVNIYREIEYMKAGIVAPDTIEGTLQLLKNWLELTATQKAGMKEKAKELFQTRFNASSVAHNWKKTLTEMYSNNA